MSMRRLFVSALLLSSVATLSATDVLMEGVDTARTGWVRDEKFFTPANVSSTKLLWRVQLNSIAPVDAQPLSAADRGERDDARRGRSRWAWWRASPTTSSPSTSRTVRCCGAAGSRTGSSIRRPSTTCSAPADRPRCRRWCRSRPASTRSTPCPGTAGCTRSTSATGRTSRRPRSSFPATASRTRSITRTASSTPRRRRAAAGSRMPSTRSTSRRAARARSFRQAAACGAAAARRSMPKAASISAPATPCSTRRTAVSATASSP